MTGDIDTVTAPVASCVITTRNRRDDTLLAVGSCFAQDFREIEVLVFDDVSDDGTVSAVKDRFPRARVFGNTERSNYIVRRNRGFAEAQGKYVFSLDDDAYFSQPDIVARIVKTFESDPLIGAIAIPYVEPLNRRSLSSLAHPFRGKAGDELRSYVGCAHAVRRDVALALGGYREFFVHQHEERDFCLRLRSAGWRIVYGDSGYVIHTVNPKREAEHAMLYGGRNQILFETLNIPFPDLFWRIPRVCWGMIRYRFSWKTLPLKLRAIKEGLIETALRWRLRSPVDRTFYRSYLKLGSHGAEEWFGPVPPSCQENGTHK